MRGFHASNNSAGSKSGQGEKAASSSGGTYFSDGVCCHTGGNLVSEAMKPTPRIYTGVATQCFRSVESAPCRSTLEDRREKRKKNQYQAIFRSTCYRYPPTGVIPNQRRAGQHWRIGERTGRRTENSQQKYPYFHQEAINHFVPTLLTPGQSQLQ